MKTFYFKIENKDASQYLQILNSLILDSRNTMFKVDKKVFDDHIALANRDL